MSQVQIVAARLALLAALLAAWALLPKYGVLDPRLLPPLGDVLAMLGKPPDSLPMISSAN